MLEGAGIRLHRIDYGIGRALFGDALRYSVLYGLGRVGLERIRSAVADYQRSCREAIVRVLYVDANAWHINPTANLLPALIRERFPAARFYGPGFVDDTVLADGLQTFADRHGPFDVALLGPATPFLGEGEDADTGAVAYLRRYASHRLADQPLLSFFADVRGAFGKLPVVIRLISLLNFDYYATTQKQIDVLLEQSIAVLGPNDQFVLALENLPDFARREKHYVKKADRFTDAWRNFCCSTPERVVTATHFVGPQEYCFDPLSVRPYDVAVPGVEYLLRKDAARRLAGTRLRSASEVLFPSLPPGQPHGPASLLSPSAWRCARPTCSSSGDARRHARLHLFGTLRAANAALRQSGARVASKWYFHLFLTLNRLGYLQLCYGFRITPIVTIASGAH